MRKITAQSATAFQQGYKFKSSNTEVKVTDTGAELYLHSNLIAVRKEGRLSISLAGWGTPTTRERLNGIDGVSLNQKDYCQYLNGVAINDVGFYTVY